MNQIVPTENLQRRQIAEVIDPIHVLDTGRFEHMQRIANVMARSSMIPETLRTTKENSKAVALPFEEIMANCFLVVNQAVRWGMDPFAVISCCSVVHGRLAYEGKLVSAVLDARLSIKLEYYFTGEPATDQFRIYLCDQKLPDDLIPTLKPGISIPGYRIVDGSAGEWKTTGSGSPWTPKAYKRMLIYRGTREWTRLFESAVLLGVYTQDELEDLSDDARARRALPMMTLSERMAASKGTVGTDGFSQEHVDRELQPTEPETKAAAEVDVPETPVDQDQEQDSSQASPPTSPEPEMTPASDSVPDAGTNSPDAGHVTGDDEERSGGPEPTSAPPSDPGPSLPEGWEKEYGAALGKAVKKDSVAKYAKQFWAQHGGWEQWHDTPDGLTATIIFNAFRDHFGKKTEIDAVLREVGAL